MAKTVLQLGQEIETLTPAEFRRHLDEILRSWRVELGRAGKFPRFHASATVAGDGSVAIVPGQDNRLGPDPSIVWSVKGIAVTGLSTGEAVDMTINGNTPVRTFAAPTVGKISSEKFGSDELVLYDSDHLEFAGTALTSGEIIVVSGRVHEVPIELVRTL